MLALNSKQKTNRKKRNHKKTTKTSFPKGKLEEEDLDKPG